MFCSISDFKKKCGTVSKKDENNSGAIATLHNFIMSRKESAKMYAPQGTFDMENEDGTITRGDWRNEDNNQHFAPLERIPRGLSLAAKNVRDEYKNYFCREGEVPWQKNYV